MDSQNIISYKKINFTGKIHLITNDLEFEGIAEQLTKACELGFDTETRASFKKGEVYNVALLQLATQTDAYLIRLQGLRNFEKIKNIFENPQILKVGAAIRDDLNVLQKMFKFNPVNFIELQHVAKQKGLKNMGLKGMTEEVLQVSLSKRAKISNWEVKTLTSEQIIYAATDAWIGLVLYQKLNSIS